MQKMTGARGRLALVLLVVVACAATPSSEQWASSADANLRIRSAKRTEKFDDGFSKLTVRDSTKDVILVIELAGISVEDFNATSGFGRVPCGRRSAL